MFYTRKMRAALREEAKRTGASDGELRRMLGNTWEEVCSALRGLTVLAAFQLLSARPESRRAEGIPARILICRIRHSLTRSIRAMR